MSRQVRAFLLIASLAFLGVVYRASQLTGEAAPPHPRGPLSSDNADKLFRGDMQHPVPKSDQDEGTLIDHVDAKRPSATPVVVVDDAADVSSKIHAFYYPWYGTPAFDNEWLHWNHEFIPHWDQSIAAKYPKGRHDPDKDDIGADFFPKLGLYSSRDERVVDEHMKMMRSAGIGVVVTSWWGRNLADEHGKPTDDLSVLILDSAAKHGLKVAFHIEPYPNRDQLSFRKDLEYIVKTYGDHPGLFRHNGLPFYYIYDSYHTPDKKWGELFSRTGARTVRDTPLDGVFICLLVDADHRRYLTKGHFDGFYTYFATNGMTHGSSWIQWKKLAEFAKHEGKLFIPSVGPGYIDESVRPWNGQNTRSRKDGAYYDEAWTTALSTQPDFVSITSFNEWHEGTQIEPAEPKQVTGRDYLDYSPHEPEFYLDRTKTWVSRFVESIPS